MLVSLYVFLICFFSKGVKMKGFDYHGGDHWTLSFLPNLERYSRFSSLYSQEYSGYGNRNQE